MDAINRLAGSRTILMIAHRLTTLRACDVLLQLRAGCLESGVPGPHDAELVAAK
jgi:ABC-type multidrug transport system fused ATPase/permease subunit